MKNSLHINPIVAPDAISSPTPAGYETATGPIPYGFTNDFMFRASLEANPLALKGLICSMLHLSWEQVISITILNPFEFGNTVTDKDSILDLKILLNDQTFINLEMQLAKEVAWPERSLSYLCEIFKNLKKGETYSQIRPAIHIGFLDYDLFPEEPEFYANYHLSNDVTHRIYTRKFSLSVLSLNRTELATEEDKKFGIDHWAKLFKATTWEELRMIAKHNPHLEEAAKTIYQMSDDERIRERCRAREEHYRILADYQNAAQQAQNELANVKKQLTDAQEYIAKLEAQLKQKN